MVLSRSISPLLAPLLLAALWPLCGLFSSVTAVRAAKGWPLEAAVLAALWEATDALMFKCAYSLAHG